MTKEEKEKYDAIIRKLELENEPNTSLHIATNENAKDYFDFIQINPTFEIIEE